MSITVQPLAEEEEQYVKHLLAYMCYQLSARDYSHALEEFARWVAEQFGWDVNGAFPEWEDQEPMRPSVMSDALTSVIAMITEVGDRTARNEGWCRVYGAIMSNLNMPGYVTVRIRVRVRVKRRSPEDRSRSICGLPEPESVVRKDGGYEVLTFTLTGYEKDVGDPAAHVRSRICGCDVQEWHIEDAALS